MKLALFFVLLSTLLAICHAQSEDVAYMYDQTFSGSATYYTYNGNTGACTIDRLPQGNNPTPEAMINSNWAVAMNNEQYTDNAVCGMCLQVHAPGTGEGEESDTLQGDFIAYVQDLCPECKTGDLDFGNPTQLDGRWDISWKAIDCPVGATNIQLHSAQFERNEYYIKWQARNTRQPVKSFEVQQNDKSGWASLVRAPGTDCFWQNSNNEFKYPVQFPVTVRITSVSGEQVQTTFSQQEYNTGLWDAKVQFAPWRPAGGSPPPPSPSPSPSPPSPSPSSPSPSPPSPSPSTSSPVPSPPSPSPSAPVPSPSNQVDQIIYDDKLHIQDWSWASSYDLADTSVVYSGRNSIRYTGNSKPEVNGYDGLYFHCDDFCFDPKKYATLHLMMNGGPKGGQEILLRFFINGRPDSIASFPLPSVTNTWTPISIALDFDTPCDGLVIQANQWGGRDSNGVDLPPPRFESVYFDEIYLSTVRSADAQQPTLTGGSSHAPPEQNENLSGAAQLSAVFSTIVGLFALVLLM